MGPQYRSCFMSPSQQPEFWKIGGPNLSDKILSCQENYIYCITMIAGTLYMEYKFSLSTQFFFLGHKIQKLFICIKISSGDACQQNTETH